MAKKNMGSGFWAAHLDAIKQEGVSKTEYAQRHGISVKRLYYWQHKLKSHTQRQSGGQTSKFIALSVAEPTTASRHNACTLAWPSGMRLEMSMLPSPDWLAVLTCAVTGAR